VYITAVEDPRQSFVRVALKAGIEPAKIYASVKTGIVPVAGMEECFDGEELEEFVAAYDEYAGLVDGQQMSEELDRALDQVDPELLRLPFVMGMFIRECPPHRRTRPRGENKYLAGSVFFYVTKALKTFEAVQTLTLHHLGEDGLSLVRTLYESYLRTLFAIREPEVHGAWVLATTGLSRGTHDYRKTKSGVDKRVIVSPQSGGHTAATISTRAMALSSPFPVEATLHTDLYSFLSGYAHPDTRTIHDYLDDFGWTIRSRERLVPADFLAFGLSLLVLDAAVRLGNCPRQRRDDIRKYLRHARDALVPFLALQEVRDILGHFADTLRSRVELILKPWHAGEYRDV
jgi:hypothetical protein